MPGSRSKVARRIFIAFVVTDTVFLAAGLIVFFFFHHTELKSLFEQNFEANPPTWWASSQLLLVGIALFVLAFRPFIDHPHVRRLRPGLIGAAILYTYFSLDEDGTIHERLSLWYFHHYGTRHWYVPHLHGLPLWPFAWALVIVLGIGAAVYLPRLWRYWPRQTVIVVLGFIVFFVGAFVFEQAVDIVHLHSTTVIGVETGVEETMENVGSTMILYAVLTVLLSVAYDLFPKKVKFVVPAASGAASSILEPAGAPLSPDR
jgi:hypothetical protein